MLKHNHYDEEALEGLLGQVLAPEIPPEALRWRVLRQTRLAWDRQHAPRPSLLQRCFGQPMLRLAWSAAALLVIALFASLLLPPDTVPLTGTALVESDLAGILLIIVGAGIGIWLWRRVSANRRVK